MGRDPGRRGCESAPAARRAGRYGLGFRAWVELGPYLLHDVQGYAAWNEDDTTTASISFVQTVDELRAENRTHRMPALG